MLEQRQLLFRIFSTFISHGTLEIRFVDTPHDEAKTYTVTGTHPGPAITLILSDNKTLRKLTFNPELGFPESYMDGTLTLFNTSFDDFIIWFFQNKQHLSKTRFGKYMGALHNFKHLFSGASNRRASQANVAHHYDLTDELYACFLDERRQYSCAYFETDDDTLASAQLQKIARIGAKLRLSQGAHILDVGCGWCELAYALAGLKKDIHVHGITLSQRQYDYATTTISERPLSQQVSFALKDYRDEHGRYDNIVSVGMLEHVGAKSYDSYFEMISRCLKEDGSALIHTIGKRRACRVTSPFITKYIFPGGYIPTLADLTQSLSHTDLHIADVECLHMHYASTLRHWRNACEAHKDYLISLYDERFYRMWMFYLTSCEYFFRLDEGVVYQIQLIKKRDKTPTTRQYISEQAQLYSKKLWQQTNHFGKDNPLQK